MKRKGSTAINSIMAVVVFVLFVGLTISLGTGTQEGDLSDLETPEIPTDILDLDINESEADPVIASELYDLDEYDYRDEVNITIDGIEWTGETNEREEEYGVVRYDVSDIDGDMRITIENPNSNSIAEVYIYDSTDLGNTDDPADDHNDNILGTVVSDRSTFNVDDVDNIEIQIQAEPDRVTQLEYDIEEEDNGLFPNWTQIIAFVLDIPVISYPLAFLNGLLNLFVNFLNLMIELFVSTALFLDYEFEDNEDLEDFIQRIGFIMVMLLILGVFVYFSVGGS